MGPDNLDRWRGKVKELAGSTDLLFHDLRHEAISRLCERGEQIAEKMG